jgi:enoyl-CoA hydratase/carnithine racemase
VELRARVTAHRIALPEALTLASLDALASALDRAAADSTAGVWVLHGSAKGVFCRGMDLSELAGMDGDVSQGPRVFTACLERLGRAARPTIALVDGETIGGGIGLAAACDLVVATPASTFALPETLFGILPAIVMPVLLERLTPQKARLLALAGTKRTAAWAREHELVDDVIEASELGRYESRAVRDLSRSAPRAVVALRSWVEEIAGLESRKTALARGLAITAELVNDASIRETVRRFVEEGQPPWETQ